MMGIILCEGTTDQILLSKYFCARYDYEFNMIATKKAVRILSSNSKEKLDTVKSNVYVDTSNPDNLLYISSTNGKSNLSDALNSVLYINQLGSDIKFDYIAILTDHDSEEEIQEIKGQINQVLQQHQFLLNVTHTVGWKKLEFTDAFQQKSSCEFLFLVVPTEHNGALETFLLDALHEEEDNKYLVDESRKFVKNLYNAKQEGKSFPDGVLKTRRLRTKAPLATFFGVVNPEGGFKRFEEFLNAVDWGKYEEVQKEFHIFDKVLEK